MSELGIFPIVAISLASVTTAALIYTYLIPTYLIPTSKVSKVSNWTNDSYGILKRVSNGSLHSENFHESLIDQIPPNHKSDSSHESHKSDSGRGRRRKYTNKNKNNRSGKRNK